jgi:hypothetical protein
VLSFGRCPDTRSVFLGDSKHVIIFYLARSCSPSYFTALRAASTLINTESLIHTVLLEIVIEAIAVIGAVGHQ